MELQPNFRSRLKHLLDQEGLDEETFANQIGRGVPSVKKYLAAGVVPRADVIMAILERYPHWSIDYLLAGRGPAKVVPKQPEVSIQDHSSYGVGIQKWLWKKKELKQFIATLPDEAFHSLASSSIMELDQLWHQVDEVHGKLEEMKSLFIS